jgi:hypothetical protein
LPRGVDSYAMAATIGKKRGDLRDRLLGDGIVPVRSALGLREDSERSLWFPKPRQWIGYGMKHLDLLGRTEVSDRLVRWFASGRRAGRGRGAAGAAGDPPILPERLK